MTPDRLATLTPVLRALADLHLSALARAGIRAQVVQGLRTEAEQAKLYAQGRTVPGKIVTRAAHASDSAHGPGADGLARGYDIAIYDGLILSWAPKMLPLYDQAGEIGKGLGLAWGGDWPEPKRDRPHYQLPMWRTL